MSSEKKISHPPDAKLDVHRRVFPGGVQITTAIKQSLYFKRTKILIMYCCW